MVNRPRQKGTTAESALIPYLHERGFTQAERRALRGGRDCGDVCGIPDVVLEVKNATKVKLAEWVKEARVEAENDGASVWFVVAKPVGVGLTSVDRWYAITSVDVMCDLLSQR